jgi:hypothetical protein
MIKWIAETVWSASEAGVLPPLGRFAPWVFGLMIGRKPHSKK